MVKPRLLGLFSISCSPNLLTLQATENMMFRLEVREAIRAAHRPSQRRKVQRPSAHQDDGRDDATGGDGGLLDDPDDVIDPDDLTATEPVGCAFLALSAAPYRLGYARADMGLSTPTSRLVSCTRQLRSITATRDGERSLLVGERRRGSCHRNVNRTRTNVRIVSIILAESFRRGIQISALPRPGPKGGLRPGFLCSRSVVAGQPKYSMTSRLNFSGFSTIESLQSVGASSDYIEQSIPSPPRLRASLQSRP
jgi:hypothetical protein